MPLRAVTGSDLRQFGEVRAALGLRGRRRAQRQREARDERATTYSDHGASLSEALAGWYRSTQQQEYCGRMTMLTRRETLAGLAATAALAGGRSGQRAELHQAGSHHRSLRAGRHVRHPGAADRAEAVGSDRPAGDRREQAERLGQHRRRLRRQAARRRPHAADHRRRHAGDAAQPGEEARLRRAEGPGAGRHGDVLAVSASPCIPRCRSTRLRS